MNTQISIRHGNYSPDVRDLIESRLGSLSLFGTRLDSLTARLAQSSTEHDFELVAGVGREGTLVARAKTGNLQQAVDEAIDRLTSQLRKLHERRVQRRRGH